MDNKHSIRSRFNGLLIVVYVLSLLITVPVVYLYTKYDFYNRANQQLSLMNNMVRSIRQYITEDVRPALLQQKVLYPPAISSTVATTHIAEHFKKLQPDYYIRVVSDNPLNKANYPEPLEQELLNQFRQDTQQTLLIREGSVKGQPYLLSANPTVSNSDCMLCHSKPEDAPAMIRQQYGTQSGFHYKLGEVVGINVIGVPMSGINNAVVHRSLGIVGILTCLFTLMLIWVNWMVRTQILMPIEDITIAAQAISKGDLEADIGALYQERNDEIGQLSHAIELMRRSFVKMLERMNRYRPS